MRLKAVADRKILRVQRVIAGFYGPAVRADDAANRNADAEKLAVIKEYGATRISINPQTFSDEVLRRIEIFPC